jgi:hypothetical protein
MVKDLPIKWNLMPEFFLYWDALKSVKYIPASPINQTRAAVDAFPRPLFMGSLRHAAALPGATGYSTSLTLSTASAVLKKQQCK